MTNCCCDEPKSPASKLLESSIMFIVKQSDTLLPQPEAVLEGLKNISEEDFWMLWKDTFLDLAAREGYFDRVWGSLDKFLASRGEYFENTWGGAKYLIRRIGKILEKTKQETEKHDGSDTVSVAMNATERPPLNTETVPKATQQIKIKRAGIDALQHVIGQGISLIGAYESGAYIAKDSDFETAFTSDIETIKSLMNGEGDKNGRAKGTKIEQFRFSPANACFLCIDIDRGHANGVDGLSEFYKMFEDSGIYRPMLPTILKDIEHGSFPVYTASPSGGFHLYFRYKGQSIKKCILAPNVEIFHTKPYLTAPGSYKSKNPYILYGNLNDAPKLLPIIELRLHRSAADEQQGHSRPKFTYQQPKEKEIPSLEQIAKWAEHDENPSGKNELCFAIARRAARTDYHYSQSEVTGFLQNYPGTRGHKQIRDAVRSAYKYKK